MFTGGIYRSLRVYHRLPSVQVSYAEDFMDQLDRTAIPQLRMALAIDASNRISTLYRLGLAHQESGELDEAAAYYEKVLQLEPMNAKANNNFAIILAAQGKFDGALSHYALAMRGQSGFTDPLENIGNVLLKQGKADEAVTFYIRALEVNPKTWVRTSTSPWRSCP